jgi:hypothetical protein
MVRDLSPDNERHLARIAGVCLLLLFMAQGVALIRGNAPTYDEGMHLASGYSYLARRDFRLEPQNPPFIKVLLASALFFGYRLPFDPPAEQWRAGAAYAIGQAFLYSTPLPADLILTVGRLSNLLLGALLVLLIGWWARRLWGRWAAIVAMALACLEPNLVAHSSLVTTDVGASLFILLTLYLLWEQAVSPSASRCVAAGIATGMALVSKYSSITLLPIIGMIVAGQALFDGTLHPPWAQRRTVPELVRRLGRATVVLLLVFIPALAILPAAYFFQGVTSWWSGLRLFLELGRLGQLAFFLGQYSYDGWWSYFPVAFLIKTPVGSLLLIFASLALARIGAPLGRREMLFLVTPVLVFFGVMTQASVNIGLRHVLPVYPFLFVLASRVVTLRLRRKWVMPSLVTVALVFTAVSALRVAPHQLAYFNELVGGPGQGWRYLSDSNLDWGQDLKRVKAFMERERVPIIYLSYFGTAPPSYYGIRYQYVPGSWPLEWPPPPDLVPADLSRKLLAISLGNLHEGLPEPNRLFTWLHKREPAARIGYSIHVYDLTDDLEALLELAEAYWKAGLDSMATAEAENVLALDPSNSDAKRLLERMRDSVPGARCRGAVPADASHPVVREPPTDASASRARRARLQKSEDEP